jgi:Type II secretion system (T2SS), protein G
LREREMADIGTDAAAEDHPRYAEVRGKVASILEGLRPEDVDHAAEIAESIRSRKTLTPASMLALLVLLLPVAWFAARWGTELVFQRRVARDADRLAQRIESYRSGTGLYPDAAAFLDPWQRPYLYSVDSRSFSIATNGADGVPGGHWRSNDVTIIFPYVNPRMAMPHAQPKTRVASP